MRKNILLFVLFILFSSVRTEVFGQYGKKREFRGVWIQCVNGQFQNLSPQATRNMLSHQLDELKKDGVNAVIFQVRAECDALYQSSIEPWSKFLTGQQGKQPNPYWDPLRWMVDECHNRGMEIHAWINPYRAKTAGTTLLANNHIAMRHPERVFSYNGQFILNPGIPENREYIYRVAEDIVSRYDVDGFHIDDYFYPYPAAGQTIPDQREFRQYNNGIQDIGDWRRNNVSIFIKELGEHIHKVKPWVKFGVSPFGIYRNKRTAPGIGSDTKGLQNYDDLYADVLLWVDKGWVDYCVPQLYWQIGHPAADYATLIEWWNQHVVNRPLFIGESITNTATHADPKVPYSNQMPAKFAYHAKLPNVQGTVLWYAKAAVDNVGNYGQTLRTYYWRYPALQPSMPFLDGKAPKKVRSLKPVWTKDGYILFWKAPRGRKWGDIAHKYVIYRFAPNEKVNIDDPSKIAAITDKTFYKLPYVDGQTKYTYVVTSLDRVGNESKKKTKKIKL